jgi:hypothetical protein
MNITIDLVGVRICRQLKGCHRPGVIRLSLSSPSEEDVAFSGVVGNGAPSGAIFDVVGCPSTTEGTTTSSKEERIGEGSGGIGERMIGLEPHRIVSS